MMSSLPSPAPPASLATTGTGLSTDRGPRSRPPESEQSEHTMAPRPPLAFAATCDDATAEHDDEKVALLPTGPASPEARAAWLSRLELGVVSSDAMTRDYSTTACAKTVDVGGGRRVSDEWEVVAPLTGTCCGWRTARVMEVVSLRHANYGLRWAGATAKRSHGHRQQDPARDDAVDCEAKTASPPFCVVGPHWWLMAATFTVLLLAALVVTVLTVPQAGPGEAATGVLLSVACLAMYAKVACSNPGIVEHLAEPLTDEYTYCGECDSYRPPDALHCMDCRACIEGYDHHCPWTGKCIGKRNVKYFYAWLFFLVLAFVYEMIEFTTYMLPPEDQPRPYLYDDDDDSFSLERTVDTTRDSDRPLLLSPLSVPSPVVRPP